MSPRPSAHGRRVARVMVGAGLLLQAGVVSGQPQPSPDQPVFRGGTQVIEVDVRVFDKDGRFVQTLARDDFEVLEDGKPQEIQTLFLVDRGVPDDAASAAPADTEGATSPPAAAPRLERASQTWIFVFDLQHITPGGNFRRAQDAVEAFLRDRFRDGDMGGIVAGGRMMNNRLSSVREELAQAVKSLKPANDTQSRRIALTREWPRLLNESEALRIANDDREALQTAIIRACSDDQDACRVVPPDIQILEKARRFRIEMQRSSLDSLTALNALASGLARMPGPKTIVMLSEGFASQELEAPLRQVVGQTGRSGSRIYSIDIRGLSRVGGSDLIDQPHAEDAAGPSARFDLLEDAPNSLAVDTGGLMIRNENNIGRALTRIAADSNRYYVIGYQTDNATFDGKFREIDVRVKRPGVSVRARKGYMAFEPSRMLTPRPITQGDGESAGVPDESGAGIPGGESGAGLRAGESPATGEAPLLSSAPVAAGPVVETPGIVGGVRLRPGATDRVRDLAGEEVGRADDLARQGWDAYQRGDLESAARALGDAASRPDARPWVYYTLGYSKLAIGSPGEAVSAWQRVQAMAPEFKPVYLDLADTYLQLSEVSKALAVLHDAAGRWPEDAEIHNAIGVIYVRRGALDEAIDAFSRAAEAQREDPLALFNLARVYEMRYTRTRRYVTSQRRWTANDADRQRAADFYEKYVASGGPYEQAAREGLKRLSWSKTGGTNQ